MGQPAGSAPAEPIIDLGELTGDVPSDRDDGPVRPPRYLTLALVAVLVAAGLVGDAAAPSLHAVLTTTFTPMGFDVDGDLLYAVDGAYAPNRVVAYRLRDGRQLWQVRSPTNATYENAWRVGGRTVLVPDACTAGGTVSTVAVDNESGREAWRRPGVPEARITGSGLVLIARPRPTARCGGSGSVDATPEHWDAVDVATGAVRWSTEVPESAQITFDSDDERGARSVVSVARDGTVSARDLVTGGITGRVVLSELARTGDAPGSVTVPDVTIAGDHVMVVRSQAGWLPNEPAVFGVTAYNLATLARRWSVRVAADASDRPGYTLAACGPMLCLNGWQWTVVLDPRDGTERWRTSVVLMSPASRWALLADRRAATDQPPSGGLTVRDIRTGQRRGTIPGWRVLSANVRRAAPPVLGVTIGDRTWLAEFDAARERVLSRGSAPGWYGSCVTEAGYLACRRIDGLVRVWRAVGG